MWWCSLLGRLAEFVIFFLLPLVATDCFNSWKRQVDNFKAWPTLNDSLANISTKLFTSPDNRYTLSLCADPTNKARADCKGGIWDSVDKVLVGKSEAASTTLQYKTGNGWMAYHSARADACLEKRSRANGSKSHASSVILSCDSNSAEAKFAAVAFDDGPKCDHLFVLAAKQFCVLNAESESTAATPAAAKSVESTTSILYHESHGRKVAAFFFTLFTLVAAYFVLGFLYKRYVEGARGVAQIPNHQLWVRLVRALQMPFIVTSSGDGSTRYRNAGWRRRPPDDFRYDQPPLLNDDGGGGDDDVENEGGGAVAAGRSQRQAVAKGLPDSDVRLLIV